MIVTHGICSRSKGPQAVRVYWPSMASWPHCPLPLLPSIHTCFSRVFYQTHGKNNFWNPFLSYQEQGWQFEGKAGSNLALHKIGWACLCSGESLAESPLSEATLDWTIRLFEKPIIPQGSVKCWASRARVFWIKRFCQEFWDQRSMINSDCLDQ